MSSEKIVDKLLDHLRLNRDNPEFAHEKKAVDSYLALTKKGINPIHKIIADYSARAELENSEKLKGMVRTLIYKTKESGEWYENFEAYKITIDAAEEIIRKNAHKENRQDYMASVKVLAKDSRNLDLFIRALLLDPEAAKELGSNSEAIYRAYLRYGLDRNNSSREKPETSGKYVSTTGYKDEAFSAAVADFIHNLPEDVFSKDDEYTDIKKLIRTLTYRDTFHLFRKKPEFAIKRLETLIEQEKNKNIRFVYNDVLKNYKNYLDFEFEGYNKDFVDPVTKEKGNFPSIHQRVGVYHSLNKQRFGILDGCGTGKTAIGALMYPLVQKKKIEQNKKVHNRVLVVGTIPCFKTWKRGFEGDESERYLADSKKITLINGERKDKSLLEELKKSEVVFANYQQLNTEFEIDGELIPTYEILAQLGYDLLVFDEVHNIRNLNEKTANGRKTASAAARHLAFQDPDAYFLLLSGTPIPDSLEDYAMIYHLLKPKICKDPEQFVKEIEKASYNPRQLATFIDENTLRRTSDEVNDLIPLDRDDWYVDVSLTPVQRQIHDYLVSHRPVGWLMEARKALLDPRLVRRETLEKAGITKTPTIEDSSKYKSLEDMVAGPNGSVSKDNKFVIFSSIFKDGITRMKSEIHDGKSFKELLEEKIQKEFGAEKYMKVIDGDVDALEREQIETIFREDKNCVGVICTTDTGGESLNFSFATDAIGLDEDYSPATTEQAIARLQRRGQSKKVNAKFIRGLGSIDMSITEYVDKKALAIKIMLDGHPPTEEEIKLLKDSASHSELTRMVTSKFGGISVDLSKYSNFDITDVEVRSRGKPASERNIVKTGNGYDTTRAQEIGMRIGKDPKCWFDEQFVKEYVDAFSELSPYLASRMRALDVVARAKREEIKFPKKILALGSGPSILYGAYQDISEVVKKAELELPIIHDLDFSATMLKSGKNPVQVCADMRKIPIADKSYDFIDNASVSLLNNSSEVLEMIKEARRVLLPDGILELSVKDLYFKEGFHDALRSLGFELITKQNAALSLGKQKFRQLVDEHGHGFAESCKSKVDNWQIIIAKKTSDEGEITNVRDLWFMNDLGRDHKLESEIETGEGRTFSKKKQKWKRKKVKEAPNHDRAHFRNKDGTVDVV